MSVRWMRLAVLVFAFVAITIGAADAAAQTTDCKACGVSCNPYYCVQSCIRVPQQDCHNYGMTCYGVCYTYYDYTYGEFQCRLSEWYPCYV